MTAHEHAQDLIADYAAQDEKYQNEPTPLDWVMRAATYEWRCTDCFDKPPLLVGPQGGNLPFECDHDHRDGHNIAIACIVAGTRFEMGTAASFEGRKPGEPARKWTSEKAA